MAIIEKELPLTKEEKTALLRQAVLAICPQGLEIPCNKACPELGCGHRDRVSEAAKNPSCGRCFAVEGREITYPPNFGAESRTAYQDLRLTACSEPGALQCPTAAVIGEQIATIKALPAILSNGNF